MALSAGDAAPDFAGTDQNGNTVRLGDFAGQPLALYFYPKDDTPGCTKEACAIRDIHDDLIASGLRIVGVSPQDGDSHQRFAARHTLPYPLLRDPDKTAVRAYDVDGPLGFGVRRGTYLLDGAGVIVDAVMADIAIARHLEFIERAMAAQS